MKLGQQINFLKSISEGPLMFSMSFLGLFNPEKNHSGMFSRLFRYFSDHLILKNGQNSQKSSKRAILIFSPRKFLGPKTPQNHFKRLLGSLGTDSMSYFFFLKNFILFSDFRTPWGVCDGARNVASLS